MCRCLTLPSLAGLVTIWRHAMESVKSWYGFGQVNPKKAIIFSTLRICLETILAATNSAEQEESTTYDGLFERPPKEGNTIQVDRES